MSIQNIFTNGVLVDINIRQWTGKKQLTAQDLGLPQDKLPKAFQLGSKFLVPPDVLANFKRLDYEARKLLIESSYPYPFGGARFVPKKALAEFVDGFEDLQGKYDQTVQTLCDNYDKYRIEMRSQFIAAAKTAYGRLSQIPGYEGLDKKDKEGKSTGEQMTENDFVNMFLERIEKSYPAREKLKEKYSMTHIAYQQELPDLSQASIDDIHEEAEKVRLIEKGYQARMIKELKGYASKIIEENRTKVQEVVDSVSQKITEGGRFTETTLSMITNTIERFARLNIANDDDLEKALLDFKTKYLERASAKQIRDSNSIQQNMLTDLKKIQEMVNDAEAISALAEAYKQKINM